MAVDVIGVAGDQQQLRGGTIRCSSYDVGGLGLVNDRQADITPGDDALPVAQVALSVAALAPATVQAQSYTAAVRGVVTDVSQAVIPGARVLVKSVERNTEHTAEADAQGRYVITALPPGNYVLMADAPGFRKFTRGAFTLQVQQQATVDVQLEVGDLATSVEVQATAPLLNTTIANLGQVVENRVLLQMPLVNRNVLALAQLTAGIVGAAGRVGSRELENTNFVANGARNSTSDVLLDGASVALVEQNGGITEVKYTPSVDAVQEFKVQTNFFSAEFGQTGGAIINMITRSGTNRLHGTGYYFHRDDSLNANSFFSNRAGQPRPDTSRKLFGGVLGGPVRKDRTFFFATMERLNDAAHRTQTATLPSLQQREGDFSDYRTASGQLMLVYKPHDTYRTASGALNRRPFPGNVVPKSLMNPISLKVLDYIPKPNQPGTPNTQTDNWFAQGVDNGIQNNAMIKIDHTFSDRDRMTARFSRAWAGEQPENFFENAAHPFNVGKESRKVHNAVFDYTRAHSATTVVTLRYGLILSSFRQDPIVEFDLTSLGLPQYLKEAADANIFPRFVPVGYTEVGAAQSLIIHSSEAGQQFSGSVTKVAGGHDLKIGGEFRHNRLDYLQPAFPSGQFSFNPLRETAQTSSSTQGNGFASMLLGWGGGTSQFSHDPMSNSRSQYFGVFLQDDWRITRKLTLNLGMRYDFDRPRWEKENRYSYWNLDDVSAERQSAGLRSEGLLRVY